MKFEEYAKTIDFAQLVTFDSKVKWLDCQSNISILLILARKLVHLLHKTNSCRTHSGWSTYL